MRQRGLEVELPPDDKPWRQRRRIGVRDLLIVLGVALAVVAVVIALSRSSGDEVGFVEIESAKEGLPGGPAPRLDRPAPDFRVALLDGESFALSEDGGEVTWIVFWATWCPPCRAEMPDIQRVWQEERQNGLTVLAVDVAEPSEPVRTFVERFGITFPIGMDISGRVTSIYRVPGFPSHYLVDRQGVLREIRIGIMSEAMMRDKLARVRRY